MKKWYGIAALIAVTVAFLGYTYNRWFDDHSRVFHQQLLVLDSHLDTPMLLERPGFDITKRHTTTRDFSQVDVPRMRQGGMDGGFWVIYTPQSALTRNAYAIAFANARHRNALIDAMVAQHSDIFASALNAPDVEMRHRQRKIVVLKSLENAYPLGETIGLLDYFYDLGVRMVGIVHSSHNQFADSSTDPAGPKWNGLSPLGRELVQRANKLGMIIDASHASDETLKQILTLSSDPIILSHSGAASIHPHPRNISDDSMRALAKNGGVIQINSLALYLKAFPEQNPQRYKELRKFYQSQRENPPIDVAQQEAALELRRTIDQKYPPLEATLSDFLAHLFHALKIVGADHVGIGADWDGGGGVAGMMDVSKIDEITVALRREGISEEDIAKIWSGNLLRVLGQVSK